MTKIQLTLTTQEADILSDKAHQLGYNITRFIKYLISKEAEETLANCNFPIFKMSQKAEKIALQAIKEHKQGKTKEINSFEEVV